MIFVVYRYSLEVQQLAGMNFGRLTQKERGRIVFQSYHFSVANWLLNFAGVRDNGGQSTPLMFALISGFQAYFLEFSPRFLGK